MTRPRGQRRAAPLTRCAAADIAAAAALAALAAPTALAQPAPAASTPPAAAAPAPSAAPGPPTVDGAPAAPPGPTAPAASDGSSPTKPGGPGTGSGSNPQRDSRFHFDNGVKLYRDGNFQGALVEFEAAYRISPSAGALRNVALCNKALFRYAEAAETLKQLLREHGAELSERERVPVEAAIAELEGLVGRVVIRVSPPEATVTLDGRTLTPDERAGPLRLNVGEHTVTVSAPGYARLVRVVSVASGQVEAPIELRLEATMGFIRVTATDPDAAIAIDGEARAFSTFTGPLPPGKHLVQVYKGGFEPFEDRVRVEVGETVEVTAALGPPTGDQVPSPTMDVGAPPPPPLPESSYPRRGWYAVGTLNVGGLTDAPRGMKHTDRTAVGGAMAGIRAGYRIFAPLAAEAVLDGGGFPVTGACDVVDDDGYACDSSEAILRDYQLSLLRIGANVRLMTAGEKLRFATSLGTGSVRQELTIPDPEQDLSGVEPGRSSIGWNAFFLLELGLELNLGHVLLGAGAQLCIDGTANELSHEYSGLFIPSMALRVGWSEWRPRPGARLRPTPPPSTP
ncbi:MAG: PEGA domain-containing protein [Polyangiaceae bacterium]|nr:PEGA domain-containing protein [Polyangiaceae bacterium]